MPKLVLFDLNGTLVEMSRMIAPEMTTLLSELLTIVPVAIISSVSLTQVLKQAVEKLPPNAHLSNLYLLPSSGGALYDYQGGAWHKVYEEIRAVDKAYGVQKICERLGVSESEALFVGDGLSAGGNDEAVYKTSVETRKVQGPVETELVIKILLAGA